MITEALAWLLPVVIAITFHEASHAWVANLYGDDTAKRQGRMTFNPLRHVDRIGTILLPGMLYLLSSPVLFGYAKPVPVDFQRLRPLRKGMFMVAAAGPATNLVLAMVSALLLHSEIWVTPEEAPWWFQMLTISVVANCVLAVLNMLPILPLDGGRMLSALLPEALARRYARMERFGMGVLLAILFVPLLFGVSMVEILVGEPAMWLATTVMRLVGIGQPLWG